MITSWKEAVVLVALCATVAIVFGFAVCARWDGQWDDAGSLHSCGGNTIAIQSDQGYICIPRLCTEDEALYWVDNDLLGCVHIDSICEEGSDGED